MIRYLTSTRKQHQQKRLCERSLLTPNNAPIYLCVSFKDDFHNARLPEFLSVCRDVVTVELMGKGVGNDGAIAVAKALHGNGRVATLNLCANGIGYPGVKSLASLLGIASTVSAQPEPFGMLG